MSYYVFYKVSDRQFLCIFLAFTLTTVTLCSSLSQANAQPRNVRRNHGGRIWSSTTTMIRRHHRPGQLIFAEEFYTLDPNVWEHEIAVAGRTNGEFQSYGDDIANSYVRDGILYIKPTATASQRNEVANSAINFQSGCKDSSREGCGKAGYYSSTTVASARINTRNAFAFRYGHLEVRAKLPRGDWIWPAIWLMPQANRYGMWPQSGEIDVMESRGNKKLLTTTGEEIGCSQFGSTLHFGINRTTDQWRLGHFVKNDSYGFDSDFHNYGLIWSPDEFIFTLDGEVIGTVTPPQGGFWEMGNFTGPKLWDDDKMSPFNQPFYVILNVAVGATSGYFPEYTNPQKPWKNSSPRAREEFLEAKDDWLQTWEGEDAAMQVDYIRIWAL